MKRFKWQIVLGALLIILSLFLYLLHYAIFRDVHHIFIYMIGDIAFVPIEVLLVTVIIHRLLTEREKRARLAKLNMVIGAFFGEVGSRLLAYFSDFDPELDKIRKDLIVASDWSEEDFAGVRERLRNHEYEVEIQKVHLEDLRAFLVGKRDLMLRLLENPNLLEHESFAQLLWAVCHLTEELGYREDLGQLPDTDYKHLAGDMKRAYTLLVYEWLDYMRHLKDDYPYLFSLAMRINPFDQNASPIVR